jgi:5-methylcytosine-specific restriction endonuclease McrA
MRWDADAPDKDQLRAWRIRGQVNEYRCGAITSTGERCTKFAGAIVGCVPVCHLHLEPVLVASPFHEEGRFLIRKLYEEANELSRRAEADRRDVRLLQAKKSKLKSEVEKLRKMARERRPIAKQSRSFIIARDEQTCTYCRREGLETRDPDGKYWHIDHDIPVCRGGTNKESNLVLACAACNLAKRDRTGDEFRSLLATPTPTTTDKEQHTHD